MKQNNVVYLGRARLRRCAEKFGYGLVVLDEAQREIPTHAGRPAIEVAEFTKLEFSRHDTTASCYGQSNGGSQCIEKSVSRVQQLLISH